MNRIITTYYLEITSLDQLKPKRKLRDDLEIVEAKTPSPEFGLFLYATAGRKWFWLERVEWTRQQWLDHLQRPEVRTWVAYVGGTPAGYTELVQSEEGVQISYFGLFPQFIGQGLGGHLLTFAIEEAWRMEPKRVWVHTCTMDHPSALSNYKARGMRIYKEETFAKDLPEAPPGPWGEEEGE
jgi:GNAT superfamily N-acetyltransferase